MNWNFALLFGVLISLAAVFKHTGLDRWMADRDSEVAETAGLAKGTVYLYFPTKEDMLLELHQRHVTHFFTALMKLLSRPNAVMFDDVMNVTRAHLIRVPGSKQVLDRAGARYQ